MPQSWLFGILKSRDIPRFFDLISAKEPMVSGVDHVRRRKDLAGMVAVSLEARALVMV